MSRTRPPKPYKVQPEPMCNEPLRLHGFVLGCDRPMGHLPPDQHASTVHWKAPLVKANEKRKTA